MQNQARRGQYTLRQWEVLFFVSFLFPSCVWATPSLFVATPSVSTLKLDQFSRLKQTKPQEIPQELWCLYIAYPNFIQSVDSNGVYWKDGEYLDWNTPMNTVSSKTPSPNYPLTSSLSTLDGHFIESFESYKIRLNRATLRDQMTQLYPLTFDFPKPLPPQFDPGRIRHLPFFYKMYGSTKKTARWETKNNIQPDGNKKNRYGSTKNDIQPDGNK